MFHFFLCRSVYFSKCSVLVLTPSDAAASEQSCSLAANSIVLENVGDSVASNDCRHFG